ncbi:MAG: hypothetical protein ACK56C_08160 [Alphaproteobacteria bacterium]
MPDKLIDPSRLEGDALARWYRRSPQEVEREREMASRRAYDAFFVRDGASAFGQLMAKTTSGPEAIADCVGCHGRAPPMFPFPFRPGGFPVFREGTPQPPSKPPERDRKQCDLQYEFDTDICTGQVNEESKAVCHESAAKRLAHCLRYGEVDTPALNTFPRGRPR